ncbi:MAG: type II toxin-antitoxin system RelB/DinJ family antitoxin [Symbiobacteriaceae bacterium]|nr:type II toxin-antitoxin system RelB/DinJ family antitoxin [Symbiobacteriaceae bacterium]
MASKQINVTIRLERDIKDSAERLFDDLGMNLSTAVNIFVRQALRHGCIPFEIRDPFFSEQNQAELIRRLSDVEQGRKLSVRELIEEED